MDTGEIIVDDTAETSHGISYLPTLHLGISMGYFFRRKYKI